MTAKTEKKRAAKRERLLYLPILGGALRGARWAPASRGKLLRVLLGTYELEQTRLFTRHVGPGHVMFDIGAHVGYYSLLAGRLVGNRGKVVAFEPSPENYFYLRKHVARNRVPVLTQELAVGNENATVFFTAGSGSGTGHVAAKGEVTVPMRRLDDWANERGLSPTHLKVDVEGAEEAVLEGARETIQRARPFIFLSTHGADIHQRCCELLSGLDYALQPIIGFDVATTSELLCVPKPRRIPRAA